MCPPIFQSTLEAAQLHSAFNKSITLAKMINVLTICVNISQNLKLIQDWYLSLNWVQNNILRWEKSLNDNICYILVTCWTEEKKHHSMKNIICSVAASGILSCSTFLLTIFLTHESSKSKLSRQTLASQVPDTLMNPQVLSFILQITEALISRN